jgi:hypothetical protein
MRNKKRYWLLVAGYWLTDKGGRRNKKEENRIPPDF